LDRGGRRAIQKAEEQHSLQIFLNASVDNAIKCLTPASEQVKRQILSSDEVLQYFTQLGRALKMTEPKEKRNQGQWSMRSNLCPFGSLNE